MGCICQEECGCHEEGGQGHLRPEEALDVHQEVQVERWAHDQAGRDLEGSLPGCELGHVEDGWVRQQAPVLRPWGSPGRLAEEFRRRAGLSSRDLKSCARIFLDGY